MTDNAKRRVRYRINRALNLERELARGRSKAARYRAKHRERVLAERREYYERNADRCRSAASEYQAANPDKIAAKSRRRTAAQRRAIPSWADSEFEVFAMAEAYSLAVMRGELTNVDWNVDHIVPLVSGRVCGLHCSANLQVIPATENFSKGNRRWPDM